MRVYCREEVINAGSEGLFLLGKAEEKLPELVKDHPCEAALIYLDPPAYGLYAAKSGTACTEADYLKMMKQVLLSCRALLMNTGTLVLQLCSGSHAKIRALLDEIMGEKNFVNEIIWQYKPTGKTSKCFIKSYDTLLIYKKRARQYTNLAEVAGVRGSERTNHWRKIRDEAGRVGYTITNNGKSVSVFEGDPLLLTDVWSDIERISGGSEEKTGYSEQKPEALLNRLIKAFTRPGDLVLDPFMGSGTAAAAALKLGRRFWGIDSSPLSLDTTRQRLFPLHENPSLLESDCHYVRFIFPAQRIKFASDCEITERAGRRQLVIRSVSFNGAPITLLSAASGVRKGDIFYPGNTVAGTKYPCRLILPHEEEVTVRLTAANGQYVYITV